MIVVQNFIPVKEEFREEFEKMFEDRVSFLSNWKGFVRNEILRPLNGKFYIVLTYWQTINDFESWSQSEDFRKAHSSSAPSEMVDGKNQLYIHEVFSSTEKASR